MSRYKGDSPAKKIVRALDHAQTRYTLGEARFVHGKHLVLAGRGGDVATLLALGARNITAVDVDEAACELVRSRFPTVDVRHEDIGNAAVRDWYDSILLDFCGVIDAPKLALINRVGYAQTYGRSVPVVLGCAFQVGRDSRRSGNIPNVASYTLDSDFFSLEKARDSLIARLSGLVSEAEAHEALAVRSDLYISKNLSGNGEFSILFSCGPGCPPGCSLDHRVEGTTEELREKLVMQSLRCAKAYRRQAQNAEAEIEKIQKLYIANPAAFRLMVLHISIGSRGCGWHADPVWDAKYFSNTVDAGGVPMLLVRFLISSNREHWGEPGWSFDCGGNKTASPLLRELAITLGSELFDLDRKQVAAWRAVDKRSRREKRIQVPEATTGRQLGWY